jgi:ribosomal protein S27AE
MDELNELQYDEFGEITEKRLIDVIAEKICASLFPAKHFSPDLKVGIMGAIEYLNTDKKVIQKQWSPSECPTCGGNFDENCDDGYYKRAYEERCPRCGQSLNWHD